MKKHKKKVIGGAIVATIIAILEAYPMICPMLPFEVDCERTAAIAEFGKTKLQEAQDAGSFE